MAQDSSADAACQELNGAVIDGQEIKVDRARGGGDRRGGGGGGGFRGGRGGGGFGGGYGGGRDGGYSRGNNNEILTLHSFFFSGHYHCDIDLVAIFESLKTQFSRENLFEMLVKSGFCLNFFKILKNGSRFLPVIFQRFFVKIFVNLVKDFKFAFIP